MKYRKEKDSIGYVEVPAEKYWAAQTQRSYQNFKIGGQKMPEEIIRAFAILKKSAAYTNTDARVLSADKRDLIARVCDEILEGKLDDQFPLVVWQTGSGTQSNMNVNEVVANRAHVIQGGKLTDDVKTVHPNDDVNKSQSSNDTFPTAMHIAAYDILIKETLPALEALRDVFKAKSDEFMNIVTSKTGHAHAILIRAIWPLENAAIQLERRKTKKRIKKSLFDGPGKLSQALGIRTIHNGMDLCASKSSIRIFDAGKKYEAKEILSGPRIGIDYAEEWKDKYWRYLIKKDNAIFSEGL